MMKTSFAAAAMALLLLSVAASAAKYEYNGIDVTIERSLAVRNTIILVPVLPLNQIVYEIDVPVYNVSASPDTGTAECSTEYADGKSTITCSFYAMEENRTKVRLHFYTKSAVRRRDGAYEFMLAYPVLGQTDRVFGIVRLPEKSVLSDKVSNQSYFPSDGNVITDGRRIIITWEKENVTTDDDLSFSALFEIAGEGSPVWDLIVIILTASVVGIMVAVGLYMKRGSLRTPEAEVKFMPLLNKDEKKVVDVAAKHGGEARQKDIVRETDFSKAKVSRLIKNLTERGVIDTEAISGREKKVILKIKGVE